MDDNTIEHKMADKFVLEVPTVTIPESSPEWAAQMFPSLIKSIYDSINGVVQGMVIDYNHRFKELQSQIDAQSQQSEITKKDLIDLRSSVSDKDFIIDNQNARIAKLQAAVDKNKSYSRRSNLIFGGIAKDVQGSCTAIVPRQNGHCKCNIIQASEMSFPEQANRYQKKIYNRTI